MDTTRGAAPRRRHSRFLVGTAALAACALVAALTPALGTSGRTTTSALPEGAAAGLSSAADDAKKVPSIMSLTPAQLAAGALGTGYALPRPAAERTMQSVLGSMTPGARSHTEAVMSLTFAQLAAGAAGSP